MARPPENPESGREKGLTGIPQRIHCAATEDDPLELTEADRVTIDHFLDTLTEVAMAIAQRQAEAMDRGEAA